MTGMPENLLPPKPEKAQGSPWLSWPMAVMALLAAGYLFELRRMESQMDNLHYIYRRVPNGWEKVRSPAGSPDRLRVTNGGTVWVRTQGASAFARWDGKVWRYFPTAEVGLMANHGDGDFALDGEGVWAPTDEGVVHFDGKHWQCYKEAAASEGASLVAGGGEAWVIDSTGKLSHFAGGKWKIEKPPEVKPDKSYPKLARTANGAVWLGWQGLWRWEDGAWSPVAQSVELIGAAGDRVWLSDTSGLRSVSMDGKHWDSYTPSQTGINQPLDVASDGKKTWFASANGVVEFDGEFDGAAWRTLPSASKDVSGYRRVAVGPDGALWTLGVPTAEALQVVKKTLPIILLMPAVLIALMVWLFWWSRRRKLRQHQLVSSAVQHATGEIPEELRKGEQRIKWGGWYGIIMIGGSVAGFALLHRFWPNAPVWVYPVMVLAIHLAITVEQSLVKRTPQAWDPIGPGAPARYDWGKTWKTVAGTALVVLFLNLDRFPMLSFLRGWMLWVLIFGGGMYQGLMVRLMNGALRRGDYDRALNVIRWFNFYNPSGIEALRTIGHVLLLAGRYREAEETLRRSLASGQARASYGSALEFLGDALMEQSRYDEAMRSYEAALYAFPWRRRTYRGMAEMLLRQAKKPEQALEWIEKIIDFDGLSYRQRKQNGRPQDDYWALKAWALARLGRRAEVAPAIDRALDATAKNVLPDLATTYYRAGMAMQALANDAGAREYLARAVELDPRGRRGALAKAAMQAVSGGWEKAG